MRKYADFLLIFVCIVSIISMSSITKRSDSDNRMIEILKEKTDKLHKTQVQLDNSKYFLRKLYMEQGKLLTPHGATLLQSIMEGDIEATNRIIQTMQTDTTFIIKER